MHEFAVSGETASGGMSGVAPAQHVGALDFGRNERWGVGADEAQPQESAGDSQKALGPPRGRQSGCHSARGPLR